MEGSLDSLANEPRLQKGFEFVQIVAEWTWPALIYDLAFMEDIEALRPTSVAEVRIVVHQVHHYRKLVFGFGHEPLRHVNALIHCARTHDTCFAFSVNRQPPPIGGMSLIDVNGPEVNPLLLVLAPNIVDTTHVGAIRWSGNRAKV
jgi:hypothetical protein